MEQGRRSPNENCWLMEFAVPGKNLALLKKNVPRVKKLFKVDVRFSNSFHRDDTKMQWINFIGGEATAEEMNNAKTFIVSMTNPEACISIEGFSQTLFHSLVDEIEMSTCAFLTFKNNSVEIKGSELAAVQAQSMLEHFQQEDVVDGAVPTYENSSANHVDNLGPSMSYQTPTSKTSQAAHQFSSSAAHEFTDFSLRDPETTDVKRMGRHASAYSLVSASSFGGEGVSCNKNNRDGKGSLETDAGMHSQRNYLKNIGLANHFNMDIIGRGLQSCDMSDVVKPTEFLDILKFLKRSQEGSSSQPPVGAKNSPSENLDASSSSLLPSTSGALSATSSNQGVIIIEDCEVEVDEGSDDDDAILISSDEESVNGAHNSNAWQKPKTAERSKQNRKKGKSLRQVENLPQPAAVASSKASKSTGNHGAWGSTPGPSSSFQGPAATSSRNPLASGGPPRTGLRHIVIDGNNVAMAHGASKVYSVKGIQICIQFFRSRGHEVTAFVPESRRYANNQIPIVGRPLLEKLYREELLKFTPARRIVSTGKIIASYDDRFILNLADMTKGIVVSNDQYRDLLSSKASYKEIIEQRLLPFTIVGDHFMPPDDPLGRDGPTLDEFLRFPAQPTGAQGGFHNRARVIADEEEKSAGTKPVWQGHRVARGQEEKFGGPLPAGQGRHVAGREEKSAWPKQGLQQGQHRVAGREEEKHTRVKQFRQVPNNSEEQKQKEKKKNVGAVRGERGGNAWQHPTELQFPIIPPRPEEQTRDLYTKLSVMFSEPEQQEKVRTILRNHPNETDIMRLSNYVLNTL